MPTKSSKYISVKDAGVTLNNAVAASFNCKEIAESTPRRQAQVRAYLAAILDVVLDHRKQGYLTAEELVLVFSAGALFSHVFLVAKGTSSKLSMYNDIGKKMLEDKDLSDEV